MRTISELQDAILSSGRTLHLTLGPSSLSPNRLFIAVYDGTACRQMTGGDLPALLETTLVPARAAVPPVEDGSDLLV